MSAKGPRDFLNQFAAIAGPGLESLSSEIRQQIRTAAQAAFEKMDIVTREEFEAQQAVLLRSREKLEALEQQVAELEALIRENPNT
ncbi:MAG: hypothetical protein CMK32_04625 [Porticoccaceae bacterium]|nr:hypothetical protein [Porticoccaceae bacterium]